METLRQNQIGRAQPETQRQAGRLRPVPVQEDKTGFYLVLASLLFEFGRPQDLLPGLGKIPFATGLDFLILISVFLSGKVSFAPLQTRLWIPLFGIMAIHVPIAENTFWALMTFKDMLLTYGLYLGIVTHVNTLERMVSLIKVWVALHGLLAVLGVASGGHGVGGWLGDENDFCMVMNMVVPFSYFFLFHFTGVRLRLKYLTLLGMYVLAAMSTLSRGGFIGLASVGIYCWYRSPKKLNALIVVCIAVVFMVMFAPAAYWDEIASSTSEETMGEDGTGGARLYMWGIGMEMFIKNPIIGVGQGNFPWTIALYEEGRTFHTRSFGGRQAHSAWVTLLSEMGIGGTLIIGGMIWLCFRDLRMVRIKFSPVEPGRKHGQVMQKGEDVRAYLARAMEGGLIGYIVSSVFISTLWYPSLWVLIAFVVALRNISELESEKPNVETLRRGSRGGVPLLRARSLPATTGSP